MNFFVRLMLALARGGALLALLLPQRAAMAESLALPATWMEFFSAGSRISASATDVGRPLPLEPVRQLIDEEDILQGLGVPIADVKLMTGIAAPEPSTAVMAGIACAGICCTRSVFLRRWRRS